MATVIAPDLEYAFDLLIQVGTPLTAEAGPNGERRLVPILGGQVEGPMLNGRILPGGIDLQWLRPDGVAEIDARYTLETEDGGRALLLNQGLRWGDPAVLARMARGEPVAPEEYYFRGSVRLESGCSQLDWLCRSLFACSGRRDPDGVRLRVFRVA